MDPLTYLLISGGLMAGGGLLSAFGAERSNRKQMDFNAEQAALNRAWLERMSNTAHQREVKDLRAAGLNPILSAGGQGAAVGSPSAASVGQLANVGEAVVQGASSAASAMSDSVDAASQLKDLEFSDSFNRQKLLSEQAKQNLDQAQAAKLADDVKDGPLRRKLLDAQYKTEDQRSALIENQRYHEMYRTDLTRSQLTYVDRRVRAEVEEAEARVNEIRTRTGLHQTQEEREELNKYLDIINSGTEVLNLIPKLKGMGFKSKKR